MRSGPHVQAITITTLCYHANKKQLYCARSNKGSCCDVIVLDVDTAGDSEDEFGRVIGRMNGSDGFEEFSR